MTVAASAPARPRPRVNMTIVGPLLALAILVVIGALLNPNFLSAAMGSIRCVWAIARRTIRWSSAPIR